MSLDSLVFGERYVTRSGNKVFLVEIEKGNNVFYQEGYRFQSTEGRIYGNDGLAYGSDGNHPEDLVSIHKRETDIDTPTDILILNASWSLGNYDQAAARGDKEARSKGAVDRED